MSGTPQIRSRLSSSSDPSRYTADHIRTGSNTINPPQRRQSTFIDHPWHGFTEVKDPDFQPPTPTKKTSGPPPELKSNLPSPSAPGGEDGLYAPARSRIP